MKKFTLFTTVLLFAYLASPASITAQSARHFLFLESGIYNLALQTNYSFQIKHRGGKTNALLDDPLSAWVGGAALQYEYRLNKRLSLAASTRFMSGSETVFKSSVSSFSNKYKIHALDFSGLFFWNLSPNHSYRIELGSGFTYARQEQFYRSFFVFNEETKMLEEQQFVRNVHHETGVPVIAQFTVPVSSRLFVGASSGITFFGDAEIVSQFAARLGIHF